MRVVPRTGYVDRNVHEESRCLRPHESYPARGTWIEIRLAAHIGAGRAVVPRTGYVDRNNEENVWNELGFRSYPARGTWIEISRHLGHSPLTKSYPARGTWIEILLDKVDALYNDVVPRTGYVDRNAHHERNSSQLSRRTPHGVRG